MKQSVGIIPGGMFSFISAYNQLEAVQFQSATTACSISGYDSVNDQQIILENIKLYVSPFLTIPSNFLQNYFRQFTNATGVDALCSNAKENLMYSNTSSVYDKVLYSGQANISTGSINVNFESGNWDAGFADGIQKWNQSLSANVSKISNIDQQFNANNRQLFNSTILPIDVERLNANFSGRIGSIFSNAILDGQFYLTNTFLSSRFRITAYQVSSLTLFEFRNISLIYMEQNTLSISAQGSNLILNLDVYDSVGTISGTVNFSFNGVSSFVVNVVQTVNPLFSITAFFPFLMLLLFITVVYAIHQCYFKNQIADLRTRFELQELQDRLARADEFLALYQPDSEQAVVALNADCAIPVSMEGIENAITMLLVRQFDDYEFEEPPFVKIGAMTKFGTQTIEFITEEECCIQANACLKPRDVFSNGPQPPPSFNSESINQECYYELKIISNRDANISIGFSTCPYPPFRLPGYDLYSIGYHSSTGRVYLNDRKEVGIPCGTELKEGDVLGIGYRIIEYEKIGQHVINQTVFYFTHNGTRIGDEFVTDGFFPDKIYPSVGTTGDCTVSFNFGTPSEVFYPPTQFSIQESNFNPAGDLKDENLNIDTSAILPEDSFVETEQHSLSLGDDRDNCNDLETENI
ncbi:Rsp5p-dependent ubiquitination, sorting of cargo proteins at the multivesicular body [Boothiomyces macroporosus]|uniref:Rsp5p-dependent ubiquitination, sorting of cargo proteins at the multivesicular body n=1 Tax=Boothiomyces macroporosus TaxID=261099 RepID=A0AAD5UP70_9FUNG|nr:Rsp5p-dependent ubiquitination, sorting of cargo proteins at the multivesicular body [Boothiomyces macroporosus]